MVACCRAFESLAAAVLIVVACWRDSLPTHIVSIGVSGGWLAYFPGTLLTTVDARMASPSCSVLRAGGASGLSLPVC